VSLVAPEPLSPPEPPPVPALEAPPPLRIFFFFLADEMSVLTTGSAGCATVVEVFEVEATPGQACAAESPKPSAATATPAKNIRFIGIPPPEITAHLNPPVR
jgi:hypothetical protein